MNEFSETLAVIKQQEAAVLKLSRHGDLTWRRGRRPERGRRGPEPGSSGAAADSETCPAHGRAARRTPWSGPTAPPHLDAKAERLQDTRRSAVR